MRLGIVMPTFNQVGFISAALESYRLQTSWLRHPSSLIVVNDGSTDDTQTHLEDSHPEIDVLKLDRNWGTAEAINAGVNLLARGLDAFSWISSDNVMSPNWLEVLADVMKTSDAGAVYGGFIYKRPERSLYLFKQHARDRLLNDTNCYYGPAFLIRADVWLAAGPHRGRISHDYDHWLRVEEACFARGLPIVGVDAPLCTYNAHDKRVTVTRAHEFDAHHWQAEARKRRSALVR